MSVIRRLVESGRSFARLPLQVRLWLMLGLVPSNTVAFLLGDTLTGRRASRAATFVALTNGPLILLQPYRT